MQKITTSAIFITLLFFYFNKAQSQTSSKKASPISAFNIHSEADINKIISEIGNKRIVALGEDTHGTKEYYELRSAITKKLITEKGFNVFILENPYEDMIALQDSLYSVPLDTLMGKHLFSIYQTKEMRDLLIWLKGYSRNNSIKILGCDDSYREILPAKIKMQAKKYDDIYLDSLAVDFENRQLLSIEEFYNLPQNKTTKTLPDDLHYGYDTYLTILKIDSIIEAKNITDQMLQELMYQARSNYEIYWGFMNKIFLSRDSAMGNRINYFAENKNNKIIIWANNAHIVRSSLNGEIGKMGETIRKKNPNDYFAIGMATGTGTYSYIKSPFINDDHDFSDTLFHAELLPLKKDSWQQYLIEQKQNNYMIDFHSLTQKKIDSFNIKKPLRVVGYKKEDPEKTIFNTALYPLFDIMVFFKRTTHTTALFNISYVSKN